MAFRRLTLITHEFLPFAGGMATYTAGIANVAASWDMDLTVLGPRYDAPPPPLPYPFIALLKHHDLSPARFLRLCVMLLRQPRDTLLFAVDIRSVFVLYIIRLLTGRGYGVMIHGSEVLKLRRKDPLGAFARAAYRAALFITANSKATADIFSAHVPSKPPMVTHLGVEPRWFVPPPVKFEAGKMDDFLAARPCICTVGRLEDRKGHKQVLQALGRLQAGIGYVIAGPTVDEAYRSELVVMADKLAVPVLFAGTVSEADLRRLYAVCATHVLAAVSMPNKIEGFGLVLLEAAAQSCPSIATRVGGIPEVIQDGKTGFLVGDGDIEALAARIKELVARPDLRDEMGRTAKQHAHEFTWNACAQKTFGGVLCGLKAVDQPLPEQALS